MYKHYFDATCVWQMANHYVVAAAGLITAISPLVNTFLRTSVVKLCLLYRDFPVLFRNNAELIIKVQRRLLLRYRHLWEYRRGRAHRNESSEPTWSCSIAFN